MAKQCAGCRLEITDRRYLTCVLCHQYYDLDCANVLDFRLYNTMTNEQKKLWRCQLCRSREPKIGNSNTPIHPKQRNEEIMQHKHPQNTFLDVPITTNNPKIDPNVTIRKKISWYSNDSSDLEDLTVYSPPQGNTLPPENPETQTDPPETSFFENEDEKITLQKFTQILKQNNKYILSELNASFKKNRKRHL